MSPSLGDILVVPYLAYTSYLLWTSDVRPVKDPRDNVCLSMKGLEKVDLVSPPFLDSQTRVFGLGRARHSL